MVELECKQDFCKHKWNYKGNKREGMVVTCPQCLYKVRIPITKKAEVKDGRKD